MGPIRKKNIIKNVRCNKWMNTDIRQEMINRENNYRNAILTKKIED